MAWIAKKPFVGQTVCIFTSTRSRGFCCPGSQTSSLPHFSHLTPCSPFLLIFPFPRKETLDQETLGERNLSHVNKSDKSLDIRCDLANILIAMSSRTCLSMVLQMLYFYVLDVFFFSKFAQISHLSKILLVSDGRTDRRTDGRTDGHADSWQVDLTQGCEVRFNNLILTFNFIDSLKKVIFREFSGTDRRTNKDMDKLIFGRTHLDKN